MGKLISGPGLQALHTYKNQGADNSLTLHYVLRHFYNFIIEFVPLSVAPNLITLLGFFCILTSCLVCAYYAPTFSETMPNWVFLLNAVCLFLYQTLDNLDGKQARRTGSSSPLGELFDHGVDALTTTMAGITWVCTISLGPSILSFLPLVSAYIAFTTATWEEYYRGGLYLGYINGPIEGLLSFMGIQLVGFFKGHQFFKQDVYSAFGIAGYIGTIQVGAVCAWAVFVFCLPGILMNLIEVNKVIRQKNWSFLDCYFSLAPSFLIILCGAAWILFSPANIMQTHGLLLIAALGVNMAFVISHLTLAYLCKAPYKRFYPGVSIPLLFGTFNSLLAQVTGMPEAPFPEVYILWTYAAIVFFYYVTFVYKATTEISKHLRIQVFSLDYLKQQRKTQ